MSTTVHNRASDLINRGLSSGNTEQMLEGARILLQKRVSQSFYLMERIYSQSDPETVAAFVNLIEREYNPINPDGQAGKDAHRVLFILHDISRANNGLKEKCRTLRSGFQASIDEANSRIAEANRKLAEAKEKKEWKPGRVWLCIHDCQQCDTRGCKVAGRLRS